MVKSVRQIGNEDLQEAVSTAGIQRWVAVSEEGLWAGIAETDPAAASGWHHHSDNQTLVYLLEGRMRIEWGTSGDDATEASKGEFLYVPPNTIHREVNPDQIPARAIVIRAGQGEPVVNVAEPG